MAMDIRPATEADWPVIWAILQPIMAEGETLSLPRDGGEEVGRAYFASAEKTNFVAVENGRVLGASYVRANQLGPGSHVANCGYVTSPEARGRGVARALCAHSIEECRRRGFRAIQFNFVVSTNAPAVHLWQSLGFAEVGRLPGAFQHPRLGFVDALVMFREL
jgi:ribosomal protein S18 acetylase RimI-like enzyme